MATNATGTLREPAVSLSGDHVVLRPMTEGDWDSLERWNNDPEVLWFSEGDDVRSRPLEEVKRIYRMVSQTAYCFIIEVEGRGIGECWLQEMNLDRILARNPGRYCRRIDICIGEKELWDQGYGTEAIRLLAAFGFEKEDADLIFGCSIADYNSEESSGL